MRTLIVVKQPKLASWQIRRMGDDYGFTYERGKVIGLPEDFEAARYSSFEYVRNLAAKVKSGAYQTIG